MAEIQAGTVVTIVLAEQFKGQTISLPVAAVWKDRKTNQTQLYFNSPDIGLIDNELGAGIKLKAGFHLSFHCGGWVLFGEFANESGVYLNSLPVGLQT